MAETACHWIVELSFARYSHAKKDVLKSMEWEPVGEWFFFKSGTEVPMRLSSLERCIRGVKEWYEAGCAAAGEHVRIRDTRTNETIPAEALGL
jgi:hypothetical protein